MKEPYIYVSYKHPRLRKLTYVTFVSMESANNAPKEITGRLGQYFKYGIHITEEIL